MRLHTTPTCERCVAFNCMSGECREQSSINYKGKVNPFQKACPAFLSTSSVFKPISKKRWHKVKTMDDIETPGARFI